MGKDVGNESEDGVEHTDFPDLNEENSAHAGRGEQNDGSDPLNNMEQSHEEEGRVENFGIFNSSLQIVFLITADSDRNVLLHKDICLGCVRVNGLVIKFRKSQWVGL